MKETPVYTSMRENTEYFEIDSALVGTRFGIRVTTPPLYERTDLSYPVVYVTDGTSIGRTTETQVYPLIGDIDHPVRPYIHVSVCYLGQEARELLITRNRDFVPPGEPEPAAFRDFIQCRVDAGLLTDADRDAFFRNLKLGRADNFLAFFEEELHAEICRRYRVEDGSTGLFGSSNGGLFSLYVFTSGGALFRNIAACSPGVMVSDSTVYSRYKQLRERMGETTCNTHLYMYINSTEMVSATKLWRVLGMEFLRFVDMVRDDPLPGMRLTAYAPYGENHYDGVIEAYRGFIRKCYPLPDAPEVMNTPASMRHMMRATDR